MRSRIGIYILWMLIFMSILYSTRGEELLGEAPEMFSTHTGFQFHSRTLKEEEQEEEIQQWVIPILIAGRIKENLQIRAYQTLSGAQSGRDASLIGLENTKVRGNYSLFENTLAIHFGLSVPVTSNRLEKDTIHLSNMLYSEVLDFGVKRITEGLDLDFAFALAQPIKSLCLNLGMGYLLRGSYERFSQDEKYDPSDQLGLAVGLNSSSRSMSFGTRALYIHYRDSKMNSEDNLEDRDEISLLIYSKLRLSPIALWLFLDDTVWVGDELQESVTISNLFRNRLSGGFSLTYPLLYNTIVFRTQLRMKIFFDDIGVNAWVALPGGGLQVVLTDSLKIDFSTRFTVGKINTGKTDISGFDLSLNAGYGF